MVNILQITEQLAMNGTETLMMNIVRNLPKSKYRVDFLVSKEKQGGYYEEARNIGCNVNVIPFSRFGIIANWRKLNDFFKQNASVYDIIHYHANSFCNLEILLLARKYGLKNIIVHVHNSQTYGWYNILMHKVYKQFIGKIARDYLSCSDMAKDWGYKGSSVYDKALIIPNGIDMALYRYSDPYRKHYRAEFGFKDEIVLGTVGRLTAVKNQIYLIDIFIEVLKSRPDSKLLLIGTGDMREKLEQKVKDHGIKNKVIFTGVRKDVPQLLNAMDAFVLPSLYEGLPFVAIESQANGLPTFISENVSPQIKLSSNVHLLSIQNSPSVWADTILSNVAVNRNIDIERTLLKNYSIQATLKAIEQVYDKY